MNAIAKLRHEFKKEKTLMKKMFSEAGDDMIRKAVTPAAVTTSVVTSSKKIKLEIDPVKLEQTIKKACIPVEKRSIIFLDTIPIKVAVTPVPVPVPVSICQAKNLNGTPCKCKAKVGKFCTKHSS